MAGSSIVCNALNANDHDPDRLVYAKCVRRILILAVVGACTFTHGSLPADGRPDVTDMAIATWATDAASRKGVPVNTAEWMQLAQVNALSTAAPDHLWLMQESSGMLEDSVGTAMMTPQNGPSYSNSLAGWTRVGVGTYETTGNQGFYTRATAT